MEIKKITRQITSMFVIYILLISLVPFGASQFNNPSSTAFSNVQYSAPAFNNPVSSSFGFSNTGSFGGVKVDEEQSFDLMITIPPGGCQPDVVRSDLLEEQNVPVYCEIASVSVNPSVDISRISGIQFSQTEKNPYIAGIGFHPSRQGIQSAGQLINSPINDNLGYVVVVLKRQETEKDMPDKVEAVLSAKLQYDAGNTFGIGQTEFYLPIISDSKFENSYKDYGFWNGVGYLRAESIDAKSAKISIYSYNLQKVYSGVLSKSQTTEDIFVPTQAGGRGVRMVLKDITLPKTKAKIKVNEEEYEVYEKDIFSDYRCRVLSLKANGGGTGSAKISCKGKTADLIKDFGKIRIGDKEYEVNSEYPEKGSKNYIVYLGVTPQTESEKLEQYLVIAKSYSLPGILKGVVSAESISEELDTYALNEIRTETSRKINNFNANRPSGDYIQGLKKSLNHVDSFFSISWNVLKEYASIPLYIWTGKSVVLYHVISSSDSGRVEGVKKDTELGGAQNYYALSKKYYEEIIDKFENEPYSQTSYGQRALCNEFLLAENLGQAQEANALLLRLYEKYPNSFCGEKSVEDWLYDENKLLSREYSTWSLPDENLYVELVSISEPGLDEASVSITYDSSKGVQTTALVEGDTKEMNDGVKLTLISFDENSAKIKYSCIDRALLPSGLKGTTGKTANIDGGGKISLEECGSALRVDEIRLKRVAKVQLIPREYGRSRESNFTFSIGIEKRAEALQLSPEQALNRIEELNKTIKEWEKTNEQLGAVVEGLKKTCLATSLVLHIANLYNGFSGAATARGYAMQNIWNPRCEDSSFRGSQSVDGCLLSHGDEIDSDVNAIKGAMESQNKNIDEIESSLRKEAVAGIGGTVNTQASKEKYVASLQEEYSGLEKLNADDFTYSELKEIELSMQLASSDKLSAGAKTYFNNSFASHTKKIEESAETRKALEEAANKIGIKASDINHIEAGKKIETYYSGKKWTDYADKIGGVDSQTDSKANVEIVELNANHYLYVLTAGAAGSYYAKEIYALDNSGEKSQAKKIFPSKNGGLVEAATSFFSGKSVSDSELSTLRSIVFTGEGSYKNPIKNYKETGAQFFGLEPYKGMPSLIPFDKENGWYAGVEQLVSGSTVLGGTGGAKSYLSSGIPAIFWICNVGKDGNIDGIGLDDDKCVRIDYASGNIPNNLFKLGTLKTQKLITQAKNALIEAQRQASKGSQTISIGGMTMGVKNVNNVLGSKCTDFMSPKYCKIMFNVCDPVVCPSSRCNAGGTFRVDDVIQSGVVGSIFLCLPNIKEGVIIPVCLTGIHAGIEGWTSILKAYRDCLQESVNTGKMVGICDEIHSVYVCDFFWKQIGPFFEAIVKNIFSWSFGQGLHGGGEYLMVNDAFNNAEKSFQYFTSTYASTSKLGFGARTIAEIGSEVCKMNVGSTYPDEFGGVFEAESPYQIYAWFDEMSFNDAVAPPQSQYKVYYHIFAGNDQGHSYQVYLTGASGTIGTSSSSRIMVSSGYVNKGETASQTLDSTAPAGYKQLCVRIDTKDNCGFKSVSTDFAVNYAKNYALKDQLKQEVKTQQDCISGSPHWSGLLTINPQQAAEDVLNPELYNQGISRVCSSVSPGKGVDEERWQFAGYCDTENIKCWIDMQSVEKSIQGKGIEKMTANQIQEQAYELANGKGSYLKEDVANQNITEIEKSYLKITKDNLQGLSAVNGRINAIYNLLIFNYQKARVLWARAETYDRLAKQLKPEAKSGALSSAEEPAAKAEESAAETEEEQVETEKATISYLVKKGETWDSIAKIFNITSVELRNMNPAIRDRKLQDEDEVKVPLLN